MHPLTYSRGRFRQKWVKFSSRTSLPRNAPHSPFGPENRWGGGFIKCPWNRFSKKYVSGPNFFMKPPPLLFLGPNGLCGVFQGKNITNEEFGRFCQKRPRNRFSKIHISGPNFFIKLSRTYFRDQTNYVACFEEKLFRTKTSLTFA